MLAQFGVFGAVQNVRLGRFVFATRLQHHLDNILHPFHGGQIKFGGHHVDDLVGNRFDGGARGAAEAGKTFAQGVLDETALKMDDTAVPFNNLRGNAHRGVLGR